ncbi:MAG: hypothetical protein GF308_07150 [Candidatus Heimdallarchaeota archaeon]|nr:hypothetical protein [Candidatus Heimdallarchaeota archaeon]
MSQGKELFEGYFRGTIQTTGTGHRGTPINWLIPFRITVQLKKTEEAFKGNHFFQAQPIILSPKPTGAYPGIFDLFKIGTYLNLPTPTQMPLQHFTFGYPCSKKGISARGTVKAEQDGDNLHLEFEGIPEKFMIIGRGLAELPAKKGKAEVKAYVPVIGQRWIDLGPFSKESATYIPKFTVPFKQETLSFEKNYSSQKQKSPSFYPKNASEKFTWKAQIVKTESFYSIVDLADGTEEYVEQVGLEEARQMFLENPELIGQIAEAAEATIQEGIEKGHVSEKLVSMIESMHEKDSEEQAEED